MIPIVVAVPRVVHGGSPALHHLGFPGGRGNGVPVWLVEPTGIEPVTSGLQSQRSPI